MSVRPAVRALVRGVALAALAASAACAAQRPPVVHPPARSFPVPAVSRVAIAPHAAWRGRNADGWTHLRGAQHAEVYLHAGRAYQLVQGTSSYNKRTRAAYLLDVTADAPSLRSVRFAPEHDGEPAAPALGTAVLSQASGAQRTLDVVFEDHGRTSLLRDYPGPRALAIFERDCPACRMEVRQLGVLAASLRAKRGVLLVATAADARGVAADLAKAGVSAPVVLDRSLSLYALLRVDNVPRGYYLARSGDVVDTSIGNLSDLEAVRFANELAAVPGGTH
jgi:hypothetical protein